MTESALSTTDPASSHVGATEWIGGAACNQASVRTFGELQRTRVRPRDEGVAKFLCQSCVVDNSCLAYVQAHPAIEGVWGGKTARERQLLLAKRQSQANLREAAVTAEPKVWQRRQRLKAIIDELVADGQRGLRLDRNGQDFLVESLRFTNRRSQTHVYGQLELFLDAETGNGLVRERESGVDWIVAYDPSEAGATPPSQRLERPPERVRPVRLAIPVEEPMPVQLAPAEEHEVEVDLRYAEPVEPSAQPPEPSLPDELPTPVELALTETIAPVVEAAVAKELPPEEPPATEAAPAVKVKKRPRSRACPLDIARQHAADASLPAPAKKFWEKRVAQLEEAAHRSA